MYLNANDKGIQDKALDFQDPSQNRVSMFFELRKFRLFF